MADPRTGAWSSATAPDPPPLARTQHWMMGVALAAAILLAAGMRYAGGAIPEASEEIEAVVVSLGAAAQRLEAPPPGVETVEEEPSVVAERAEDAPPVTAPPEPRKVVAFSQGDGAITSGTGAGAGPPAPPPPPPPAPPPRAVPPPALTANFRMRSQRYYMDRVVYPALSLRRLESGAGTLRIRINRSGEVLSAELVKSTGHRRLDDEIRRVAGIVRQIDPLPANYPAETAVTDLTINFVLEYYE